MKTKKFNRFSAFAMAAAIFAGGVSADDTDTLLHVQQYGDIAYLTGGVGDDQISQMKMEAPYYSLSMTFTTRDAMRLDGNRDAYTFPEQVTVFRANGTPVLDIKPKGPFVLVNLPAGDYRVTVADSSSMRKTQFVQIVAGAHKQLNFDWVGTSAYSSD